MGLFSLGLGDAFDLLRLGRRNVRRKTVLTHTPAFSWKELNYESQS